ncbi:hypothetical protein [Amycolatopsis aidingensis]|uniref:hypothetical protein n=1 Tax=Amycolatopsis aidingensis TaxID=2842453 RepID=UPI001C0D7123|nr:hypothetical protein [Amycolatopsis aidingensis]
MTGGFAYDDEFDQEGLARPAAALWHSYLEEWDRPDLTDFLDRTGMAAQDDGDAAEDPAPKPWLCPQPSPPSAWWPTDRCKGQQASITGDPVLKPL